MLKKITGWLALCLLSVNIVHAAPTIEHWTTQKGLRVYYVEAPQLPMVDLRLVFAAGSARDDVTPGVSMLTSDILNKGAGELDADQIAEAFESVGAQYSSGAGMERSWLSLRSITNQDEFSKALKTWLTVLSTPTFPERDFERAKKQALIGLEAEKQDPGSIASKAFFENLYGDHPYASPDNGTEESIKAMSLDHLKAYYNAYYVVRNGVLAIVGDVDRQQAEAIAEKVSAALPEGNRAAAIPEVKPLEEAKTVRIDFPSTQSHIYIGQPGDKRGDEDYFTLYLGNHVFGGSGFTSRLMKEIRVKRGFVYSVYSYFQPQQELGPYILGMQTKNKQVNQAIQVARNELRDFIEKGPTEEELEQSKKNITGGFPLRTASNADIVAYVAMIGFYELPLDYLETFSSNVGKLGKAEVMDAWKRRINQEKLLTVIVGKQADIDGAEKNEKARAAAAQPVSQTQ